MEDFHLRELPIGYGNKTNLPIRRQAVPDSLTVDLPGILGFAETCVHAVLEHRKAIFEEVLSEPYVIPTLFKLFDREIKKG